MEFDFGSSPSYYSVLGIRSDSSFEEIRRAYRKLAMQWHPDRWTKNPSLLGKAKRKFQEIQQAYSVLSDRRKRTLYDAGLFNPHEEEDEGFDGFMEELASHLKNVRRQKKEYSLGELQEMLHEMMVDFQSPLPPLKTPSRCYNRARVLDDSTSVKRARFDLNYPPVISTQVPWVRKV